MKRFKKLLVFAAVLLLMVGCGSGPKKDDKKTVGLIISTLNNPFFVTLKEGAEKTAKELNVNLLVYDSRDDSAVEISNMEDVIAKKVDLIIINPTDSKVVTAAVEKANTAKIPVITVDRNSEGGTVVSHVASDNIAGGKMAGEHLLTLVGQNPNVVELEGVPGASAAVERGQGFNEAVKGKATVVARQTANFNRGQGLSVMENILQAQPKIDAVFAHNDEMALGAIEAIAAAKRTDIKVIGFDATDDAVKSVKDGKMAATVAQQPALMGEIAVKTAEKVMKGEKVETKIPVALELIKK